MSECGKTPFNPNGYSGMETQKTHYADPDTIQRMMQMESQLTDLHRALGVFNADHDRALLKAQRAIADSELLEWAEGKELHLDYNRGEVSLEYWTANEDGTLGCQEFHGPDLRDVLRQAMEWEEREHE